MKKHEAIYKKIDNLEIAATLIRSQNTTGPVLILIHGGALICGNRQWALHMPQWKLCLDNGFSAVVSVDYRLAPETKLPDILHDLQDLWQWVHNGADNLLPKKLNYALMGHSCGGYLSQLLAARLPQKPKAIFSFYGYCNIADDWLTKPSDHYCKDPEIPEKEALTYVNKHPAISHSGINNRFKYYVHLRQKGLWLNAVTGTNFSETPLTHYDQFCPITLADKNYPPTFLAHGTNDTDVPYEQSRLMKAKLDELKIPCILHTVKNAPHMFDGETHWQNSEASKQMNQKLITFINKHVTT